VRDGHTDWAKEVCNRAVIYQRALARNSGESILAFWSKTGMDLVNKKFCLAPDVKMVKMLQMI